MNNSLNPAFGNSTTNPEVSMTEAMKEALAPDTPRGSTSPPTTAGEYEPRLMSAINAMLDNEALNEGYSSNHLPPLLRLFKGQPNIGRFGEMVDFANSKWQCELRWRNCSVHKARLAGMDLSDGHQAFRDLKAIASGLAGGDAHVEKGTLKKTTRHQAALSKGPQPHPKPASGTAFTRSSPIPSITSTPRPTEDILIDPALLALSAPSSTGTGKELTSTSTSISGSGSAQQRDDIYSNQGHMPRLSPNNGAMNGKTVQLTTSRGTKTDRRAHLAFNSPHFIRSFDHDAPRTDMPPAASTPQNMRLSQPSSGATAAAQNAQSAPPLTQAQHDRSVLNPYTEFADQAQRYHTKRPLNLHLPHSNPNPTSPYTIFADQAQYHVQQPSAPYARVMEVPFAGFEQSDQATTPASTQANSRASTPSLTPKGLQTTFRLKTIEEIRYERELAAWKAQQAEKRILEKIEQQKKVKLKAELDKEMRRPDNDVLAYRYHDFMEVYPCQGFERKSKYHLGLLANQKVDDNDKSDKAEAVRYAKGKWWNYFEVQDSDMVIKMVQDKKRMATADLARHERKTGGHHVTPADIQAIRNDVPTYARLECGLRRIEGILED